ncbi:response regulator [Methylocucumis oryzae]|uniref:response regulator n=1 Tax=Methylocucumis oryzae TaxID=1632867 RepID=UPI0006983443|nr:response regulator [Methylocucumis oryzae]
MLIVDDISENRSVLVDFMTNLGFETTEAVNGREAITVAEQVIPDFIIMDIVMPALNGLDACRQLRQNPLFKTTPIIGISASTAPEQAKESRSAGMDAFISKPVDFNEFLACVHDLVLLDWIYGTNHIEARAGSKLNGTVIKPPHEQLAELQHLAKLGNMREIAQWATALAETTPEYQDFADYLQHLCKTFQSKAIMKLVDDSLPSSHHHD